MAVQPSVPNHWAIVKALIVHVLTNYWSCHLSLSSHNTINLQKESKYLTIKDHSLSPVTKVSSKSYQNRAVAHMSSQQCDNMYKTCNKLQPDKPQPWRGEDRHETPPLAEELLAFGGFLGKKGKLCLMTWLLEVWAYSRAGLTPKKSRVTLTAFNGEGVEKCIGRWR